MSCFCGKHRSPTEYRDDSGLTQFPEYQAWAFPNAKFCSFAMLRSIASSSRFPTSSQWNVTGSDSMGMLRKERLQGCIKSWGVYSDSQARGTAILNSIMIAVTSGLCIHGSYRKHSPLCCGAITGAELCPTHCGQRTSTMLNWIQRPLQLIRSPALCTTWARARCNSHNNQKHHVAKATMTWRSPQLRVINTSKTNELLSTENYTSSHKKKPQQP